MSSSFAEFRSSGEALPFVSAHRFGASSEVPDTLGFGSSLSLRSFSRVVLLAFSLSVLDCCTARTSLALKDWARLGRSLSTDRFVPLYALRSVTVGTFKDVRFFPMLNFGHFLGPLIFSMFSPHHEFWPFLGLSSPSTFHNVKNHGGGGAEGEPGRIARNEEQETKKKTTQDKQK